MRRPCLATLGFCLTIFVMSCSPADSPEVPAKTEPEAARTPTVTAEGIAYTDSADGAPAVLLIPGWCCEKEYWRAQVEALDEDYRVVTLDLGGHGASAGIGREEWTVDSLAEDVVAVADELDLEQMILVGHSMGGPVSVLAAGKMPGRVIGIVGVDTLQVVGHHSDDDEQFAAMLAALEADFPGACDAMVRGMFGPHAGRELVDETSAMMCDAPAEVALGLFRDFGNLDLAAGLEKAGVPLRLINASLFPTDQDALRAHAEDFDARILEGVGHFLFLEDPERFNVELRGALAELTESEADGG